MATYLHNLTVEPQLFVFFRAWIGGCSLGDHRCGFCPMAKLQGRGAREEEGQRHHGGGAGSSSLHWIRMAKSIQRTVRKPWFLIRIPGKYQNKPGFQPRFPSGANRFRPSTVARDHPHLQARVVFGSIS